MSHHGIAAPKNNSTWVQAHVKLKGGAFGRRSANGVTDMFPDLTFTNPHRGNKPPPPRLTSEPTWKDPFAQVGAFEPSLFDSLLCFLTCSWRTGSFVKLGFHIHQAWLMYTIWKIKPFKPESESTYRTWHFQYILSGCKASSWIQSFFQLPRFVSSNWCPILSMGGEAKN